MAQNSFALMTNLGRAKEAAALADGTAVVITHIAIGDGTTVPSGGETALYHEVARKVISGHGTVIGTSNVAYFDIFLAAAEGPYTIREAGLYDDAGDLIAIARYDPPINKPVPASGQTVEGTVRLEVAFSNIANVIIVVDPTFVVPLQRLSHLPWISVLSMTVSLPPASPAIGDTYLVPIGATGPWVGQSGKVAEYTVAGWSIINTPDGHGVSLPDGRIFEKVGGVYIEKLALDVQSGKWNYAVATGTANALIVTVTPAPIAYTAGLLVFVKLSATNTSRTPTINLNGLGVKNIKYVDGSNLLDGELAAGRYAMLIYDGANFILMNPWVIISRQSPRGAKQTRAFTPNIALSDLPVNTNTVAQSITITGTTYADCIAYCTFRNMDTNFTSLTGFLRITRNGVVISSSDYLGCSIKDSFQTPITIRERFYNLNPDDTYVVDLMVKKEGAIGPVRIQDSRILALHE